MDMISAALATGLIRVHYTGDAVAQHEAVKTEYEVALEQAAAARPQEPVFGPLSRAARRWLGKLEPKSDKPSDTNSSGERHA
ncbi:hypothetical protein [Chitinimonas sp.]|uniref:hypothetical protein n=1 Tax=Chitinimonas sp. TaxID=1934313 RepID=UPI002F91C9BE